MSPPHHHGRTTQAAVGYAGLPISGSGTRRLRTAEPQVWAVGLSAGATHGFHVSPGRWMGSQCVRRERSATPCFHLHREVALPTCVSRALWHHVRCERRGTRSDMPLPGGRSGQALAATTASSSAEAGGRRTRFLRARQPPSPPRGLGGTAGRGQRARGSVIGAGQRRRRASRARSRHRAVVPGRSYSH